MAQSEGRVIKPPVERVVSGRVFRPSKVLMVKKWFKLMLFLSVLWIGLWAVLFSSPEVQGFTILLFEPLEIVVALGWPTVGLYYWLIAAVVLVLAVAYIHIYVSRIEYSVIGWQGEAMPEIYVKKGIINITRKHVPFRTIVFLRTRRGPFDRLLGIGNVMVDTAGGSGPQHQSGLITLLITNLSSSAAEERIEGIRFHEELRDFILRELRGFARTPLILDRIGRFGRRRRILNEGTLIAFREIRDVLRARQASATG